MLCFLVLFAGLGNACGSAQTQANRRTERLDETAGRFPFSLKEPEAYQADVITTAPADEDKYFIARKGNRWRYDFFRGGRSTFSEVRSDRLYHLDHVKKIYSEQPITSDPTVPTIGGVALRNLFRGTEHFDFDEVSRDGSVVKYRAHSDTSKGDTFIYFDTAAGMITREEFLNEQGLADFVYELRNVKMEVDDAVFAIPAGYKKVSVSEISSNTN